MPYLLLLVSLMFVSCKKDNQIKKSSTVIQASEQRTYLSHSHGLGESKIRNKLLNQLVEEKFPTGKIENAVKNYDELEGLNLTKDDLNTYMEKERLMTKLVVSSTDRLDIYFLPRGVALNLIPGQLGIKAEAGRVLKWLSTPAATVEGSTLYLIHVNHEDLMENDKTFYQETYNNADFADKKGFILNDGREAQISLKHDFYREQTVAQTFKGRIKSCSRDLMEAGECQECLYKRQIPSGQFALVPNVSLDEVGFRLMINGERFLTSELPSEFTSDGVVRFKIKSSEFLKSNQARVEIEKTAAPVYQSESAPYDYSGHCVRSEGRESFSLQSKAQIYLSVKVLGRGDMLRAVSL